VARQLNSSDGSLDVLGVEPPQSVFRKRKSIAYAARLAVCALPIAQSASLTALGVSLGEASPAQEQPL